MSDADDQKTHVDGPDPREHYSWGDLEKIARSTSARRRNRLRWSIIAVAVLWVQSGIYAFLRRDDKSSWEILLDVAVPNYATLFMIALLSWSSWAAGKSKLSDDEAAVAGDISDAHHREILTRLKRRFRRGR